MTLLPHGSGAGHDDVSLEDTTAFQRNEEQSIALVVDRADELDQPVLLDADANLVSRRCDYEPIASVDGGAAARGISSSGGDHDHRDANDPDYRPSHEYDPVYVPRHDAESMARRVDESSYVRTPRARRCVDPYEEVRSDGQGLAQRQAGPRQPAVVLPEEVGPAPVAPPRIASVGRVTTAGRERRAPPPIVGDASFRDRDGSEPVAVASNDSTQQSTSRIDGGNVVIHNPYEPVDFSRSASR
jgi:hypothetical protein